MHGSAGDNCILKHETSILWSLHCEAVSQMTVLLAEMVEADVALETRGQATGDNKLSGKMRF